MRLKLRSFPMRTVLVCTLSLFTVMAFIQNGRVANEQSALNEAQSVSADAQPNVDDVIKHTFKVRPGGELLVDTDRGSIEIVSGASDEVRVAIERTARGSSDAEIERLKFSFDEDGDRVSVFGKFPDNERSGRYKFKVHIRIEVPEKFDVNLNTAGGSVSVADLIGTVDAETSGGSLSFGRISGPVNGRTSGGSIKLEEGSGDAYLRTSGGSISLGRVSGDVEAHTSGGSISIVEASGSVVAKTSGGSIEVKEVHGSIDASTSGGGITAYISEQPASDSRLSTGGGHVTVRLNPALNLDVKATASGGGISVKGLPIEVSGKKTKTRLVGAMNAGGPQLEVETSGGGITLKAID